MSTYVYPCHVCGEDLSPGYFHYKIEVKGKVEMIHIPCLSKLDQNSITLVRYREGENSTPDSTPAQPHGTKTAGTAKAVKSLRSDETP